MIHTRTYKYDFNCDQNKNVDSEVYSAINDPGLDAIGPVRAMFLKIPRDLKCFNPEVKAECFKFYLLPRAMWLRG